MMSLFHVTKWIEHLREKNTPSSNTVSGETPLLLNTTISLTHWLDWSPSFFSLEVESSCIFHQGGGDQSICCPPIALTYLTFTDMKWWPPAPKVPRYVGSNVLTRAPSGDSHRGRSQNVLPWCADGNQRKSISNDRLLLSTQLIQLVIAVGLIEWLLTAQTLRQVYEHTHTHPYLEYT